MRIVLILSFISIRQYYCVAFYFALCLLSLINIESYAFISIHRHILSFNGIVMYIILYLVNTVPIFNTFERTSFPYMLSKFFVSISFLFI